MNAVETAVFPLKAKAVEAAEQRALEKIASVMDDLSANGWDLNVCAPRPHGMMSRAAYKQAAAKVTLYASLTSATATSLRHGQPDIRVRNPLGEANLVAMFRMSAAASFDAYVAKLNLKIGECASATLRPLAGVWGYSELDVVTVNGVAQTWRTQMILNCSVLGTLFNQWPTRQVLLNDARKAKRPGSTQPV
jgi:hypothetical protein